MKLASGKTGILVRTGVNAWITACVIVFIVLICCRCSEDFGNRLAGFETEKSSGDVPDILTGRALLEDQWDHHLIRVELKPIGVSMLTDGHGLFQLPEKLQEGNWTLTASYPYYQSVDQDFLVVNGTPDAQLETMDLQKAIEFSVTTNGSHFRIGSTVQVTMAVENVATKDVTLSSTKSPMAAFAVRKNGQVIYGSLLPGLEDELVEVTLEPGDTNYYEIEWTIDDPALESGEYELFAILTTNATHPDYFDASTEESEEFNSSLYGKLAPAVIDIE